jgi:hypothetical protein
VQRCIGDLLSVRQIRVQAGPRILSLLRRFSNFYWKYPLTSITSCTALLGSFVSGIALELVMTAG